MNEPKFKPDFLIIPYQLFDSKELRPSDMFVYGALYWFQHMKDGNCFASNKTIGDLFGIGARSVQASLERLEAHGFVKRFYDKEGKRTGMLALISYRGDAQKNVGVRTNERGGVRSNVRQISNNLISNKEEVESIYLHYKEKIQPKARLTDGAMKKINARLKSFTAKEIKRGIDNFAASGWHMKNNADKGLAWFARSDEKMEYYVNMADSKPKTYSYKKN